MLLILLPLLMLSLLLRTSTAMAAASAACRLFITAVFPGLFPYLTLSLLFMSRLPGRLPAWGVVLLGWGGGSPTGARLAGMMQAPLRHRIGAAVATATMSPMYLLGTIGAWLHSPVAGAVTLCSVLAGGAIAGAIAARCSPAGEGIPSHEAQGSPLSFGQAIDQASRTMLLVCGTMVMWCVFASLLEGVVPEAARLPLTTVMEVTTGTAAIAGMPWPLPWRTALIAGATGFGGLAILMQNHASGAGLQPLPVRLLWQGLHGVLSFLLALGMMFLLPG